MSGDTAIVLRKAFAVFGDFKTAFAFKGREHDCKSMLATLKGCFIQFPTFLDPSAESPRREQEVTLVRDVLEHAVLLSARLKELDEFAEYMAQVRVYYSDMADGVPPSERRLLILGMNLLRLLVCRRVSEFHSDLELIPLSEQTTLFIRMPVLLERYTSEGSYHKLLHARGQVPSNEFLPLVEMLEETVRREVANCIPKAYTRLSFVAAQKLLMFSTLEEVKEFGSGNEWTVDGAGFIFEDPATASAPKEAGTKTAAGHQQVIPFAALLSENIQFAVQLQRVV